MDLSCVKLCQHAFSCGIAFSGFTSLHVAAEFGNSAALQLLVAARAQLEIKSTLDGYSFAWPEVNRKLSAESISPSTDHWLPLIAIAKHRLRSESSYTVGSCWLDYVSWRTHRGRNRFGLLGSLQESASINPLGLSLWGLAVWLAFWVLFFLICSYQSSSSETQKRHVWHTYTHAHICYYLKHSKTKSFC